MPTTFSVAWKNSFIDCLAGRSSPSNKQPIYMVAYNGAQPSLPTDVPAGSAVYSSYSSGIALSGFMSQPSGGVTQMAGPRSANASSAVASLTFSRFHGGDGVAIIDTPITLSGGGGGVIAPSLSSSAGVAFSIDQFSLKVPSSLSTVMYNDALRDAMCSAMGITAANVAALSSASIKVYSGSAPANANLPATGNLLATFTTAASGASWNAASAGSAALASNLAAVVSGAGTQTAGYARIEKGTYVLQLSIGTSGTDIVVDDTSFANGATRTITNATITL